MLSAVFALSMAGCANSHKGRALSLVMASDAVADEVANVWEAGVDAQIEHCKQTLSQEQLEDSQAKADCMGIFGKGDGLEAATQTLVTTQTAIAEAAKCEELKSCPSQVDWQKLKTEVLEAWTALQPYYDAIAKGK